MNEPQAKSLVLIDGSGYIFRAFFALPPMTRPDGTPVNAVFGFANMLFKLMQDRPHDDLVVVFDYSGESFRNQLYDQYKANRDEPPKELVPQFALVREAARAFGLPVIDVEGFEADDLIAAYAKRARDIGEPVTVVSSDKDLMQLVADGVAMWDPMKQKAIGRAEVIEKFGVGPELVCDALALIGDTSDNVPGVPGIGPKSAAQLLTEYGSLEGLLANLDQIKQPKRREVLEQSAEKARLSYRLVCLDADAPLPLQLDELRRKPFDAQALLQFLHTNGFKSLAARIDQVAAAAEVTRAERKDAGEQRFAAVTTLEELDAILARAVATGLLALDTETTSLDVWRARLVGVCLAVEPGEGFYVPLAHVDDFGQRHPGQLDLPAVVERLRPVLADPAVLKVGHNIKYDAGVLAHYGLAVTPIDDTMLVSYVLGGASHGHGMDELAQRVLDYDCITYASLCGKGAAQIGFAQVPVDKATAYAAEDAEVTLRLWHALRPRLLEERMLAVYETLDRPLSPIVTEMERHGIKVDAHRLRSLSGEFTQRMAAFEDQAYQLAGRSFNLGSPKQLGEVLFDELGLGGAGRKTKTGAYATGVEVLEELALQGHELPRVILNWRQLQKLTRTYTDTLVEQVNPDTGRVHTSYSLAATSTGRLSSNDPNLQNIPIRTEEGRKIREAFVPEDGYVLVSADYSQIELRILAHIADIATLKDGLRQGRRHPQHHRLADVRRAPGRSRLRPAPLRQDHQLRHRLRHRRLRPRPATGHPAGAGQGLHRQLLRAISRHPRLHGPGQGRGAREGLRHHPLRPPLLRSRDQRQAPLPPRLRRARRHQRPHPGHGSRHHEARHDPHLARPQAGAARGAVAASVHDELVFEVPERQVADAQALVKRTMERAAAMSVPLVVEVGHGASWEKAH